MLSLIIPSDSDSNSGPILNSRSKSNYWNRVGLGVGISGFGLCCVFRYVYVTRRKEIKRQKSFKAEIMTGPRQFSFKEVKIATKEFHNSRILGHGALGTVYKAYFVGCNNNVAAVKRSKNHTHEGKAEFLAELSIIACLRHKNSVHLQGFCVEKGELYDYMSNGSLHTMLYPDTEIVPLLLEY